MVSTEVKFNVCEEETVARPIILLESSTMEARASAKNRELAELALELLTL
tara:strand:- start:107 stop:256 length:150 start_codon:yes stop_codon:yes gene_type:complete